KSTSLFQQPARGRCRMSATRRVFPETFKREAVDRVASSGLPGGRVAAELGVKQTGLPRWGGRRRGRRGGGAGGGPLPAGAAPGPGAGGPGGGEGRVAARKRAASYGARHPKKSRAHLRIGLPMKFGFVDEHRRL